MPPKRLRDDAPFYDIFCAAMNRQEQGIIEYGESSFMELDMYDEMEEEMLDIIVYAYLQIVKVRALKNKNKGKL